MFYVYILFLNNKQLYTGYTHDLKRRIKEHYSGRSTFASTRLPVRLIHYEVYAKQTDAERRERYLKTTEGKRFLRQQLRDLLEDLKIGE